jgi:pimeloyl-ACP methyl ester carboxylesterase
MTGARLSVPVLLALLTASCIGEVTTGEVLSGDGVPIRYAARGMGGPALVFVHGWACDRTYWDAQLGHFAPRHRVVTIDLPGHGESGTGREEWTVEAFGEDVATVVEQLGLEEVVLIGHSVGGFVVLEAARRISDRLAGVVGVEAWYDPEMKLSAEQVRMILEPLRDNFAEMTESIVRAMMFAPGADSALVDRVAVDMGAAPPGIALAVSENSYLSWSQQGEGALRAVEAPLGAINAARSPTNVESLRRYAPSMEVRIMDGVGHFAMMEDPETFNRLLEELLSQLPEKGTD